MRLLTFPNGNTGSKHDAMAMLRLYLLLSVVAFPVAFLFQQGIALPVVLTFGLGSVLGGFVIAQGGSAGAPMRGLGWMCFGIAFVICAAFALAK